MSRSSWGKLGNFGIYTLVAVTIWSPYFTPPVTIGPEGFVRLDQIVLPLLVVTAGLIQHPRLRLSTSPITILLLCCTLSISISVIFGPFYNGYRVRTGDVFDIFVWFGYSLFVMVVTPSLPSPTAKRGVILTLILSVCASVLALFQTLDFSLASEVLGPLYASDTHLQYIVRRPTGTTINPNVFAQFLSLPMLISFAVVIHAGRSETPDWLRRWRPYFIVSLIVLLLGILSTLSRTGLVTAFVGSCTVLVVVMLFGIGKRVWRKRIIVVSFVSFAISLFTFVLFEGGMSRFSELANPLEASSLQVRFEKWEQVLPLIMESPLIGHGPSKQALNSLSVTFIDSGVLSWIFHFGVIGMIAFIALVIAILGFGCQILTSKSVFKQTPLGWSTVAAVVGWTVGSLVVWPVKPVAQSRRAFTLYLILIVLSLSIYKQLE